MTPLIIPLTIVRASIIDNPSYLQALKKINRFTTTKFWEFAALIYKKIISGQTVFSKLDTSVRLPF